MITVLYYLTFSVLASPFLNYKEPGIHLLTLPLIKGEKHGAKSHDSLARDQSMLADAPLNLMTSVVSLWTQGTVYTTHCGPSSSWGMFVNDGMNTTVVL